jgi:hypothetical protein
MSWLLEYEKHAKAKAERLREIQTQLLPDRMLEAGMANFKLATGFTVDVADVVRGSIPSLSSIESEKDPMVKQAKIERRAAAFKWLRDHNADSLIKTEVSASFEKGEGKKADKVVEYLLKQNIPALKEEAVHPATLTKFLKEQFESGENIPSDTFDLYTGKVAQIKPPKVKK